MKNLLAWMRRDEGNRQNQFEDNKVGRFVPGMPASGDQEAGGETSGKVNQNLEPFPKSLWTPTRPPCASTRALQMYSPSPRLPPSVPTGETSCVELSDPRWKSSHTRPCSDFAIPRP